MKKILIAQAMVFLLLVAFKANGQNCSQFHEGRFNYKELKGAVSVRKGNKQTSYYSNGSTTEYKVEWQDSCNFTLTFEKASDPNFKAFKKGDVMYIKIVEVVGNCYKFEAVFDGQKIPPTCMCKDESL